VSALGLDAALAILGTFTAIGLLVGGARFRRLGGDVPPPPEHLVERVLADPVFAHLGGPAAAGLADRIEIVTAQPGDDVITEGEPGDHYYLVVAGRLAVTIGSESVGEISEGGSFGEIALIRDVPRAATVTCVTPVELYAISRDDFLMTVTGHPRSMATATQIADDLAPR
jgi:CRP-like cAMP-binding protein